MVRRGGRFSVSPYHFAVKIAGDQVGSGNFREMQPKRIDQKMLAIGQNGRKMVGDSLVQIVGDRQVECGGKVNSQLPFGLSSI
jgi:hypothetical protein